MTIQEIIFPKIIIKSLFPLAKTFVFCLFLLPILVYIGYHLAYRQKIYPGVAVGKVALGNATLNEATQRIDEYLKQHLNSHSLVLRSEEKEWLILLEKIDLEYNPAINARKAFLVGRSQNLIENLKAKKQSWSQGISLDFEYSINQELLEKELLPIADYLHQNPVPPKIFLAEGKVVVEPGITGRQLDQKKLKEILKERFAKADLSPIILPLYYFSAVPDYQKIAEAKNRAERLVGKRLLFTLEGQTIKELSDEAMIKLVSFSSNYNKEEINRLAAELASAVNQSPQNALFRFSEGKVSEFRPAMEGKSVKENLLAELITSSLTDLETHPPEIRIEIPFQTIPPAITMENVNNFGIKELVGRGISYFRGSITSRIHNITLASSRLNGLLIAPGETFSFNQTTGEISKSTGYQEAYIIKEGRTILGDGGGVCQVSTTLFRAALDAGLSIKERHAHAYRVSYYEQDSPAGLDATVFSPTADLKIQNNTPAHLLIQAEVNLQEKMLKIDLYGTNDGRQVKISKTRIWDLIPPPPDLYQEDPTLPVGVIKQVDWKAWGAKAAFDYRVERQDAVIEEQTFFSNYRPWQAVFLKGTKV